MNLLLTAGPTREAIDPVRYLTNHSSGKMGYALAHAAAHAGHTVTLVSGPVNLPSPSDPAIRLVPVISASEMFAAVMDNLPGQDAAILCAAVADFTPRQHATAKIKKTNALGSDGIYRLELVPTPDILAALRPAAPRLLIAGFAAETDNLEAHAHEKLHRKGCDLILANDITRPGLGFGSDHNALLVLHRDGRQLTLPPESKTILAQKIIQLIESELAAKTPA